MSKRRKYSDLEAAPIPQAFTPESSSISYPPTENTTNIQDEENDKPVSSTVETAFSGVMFPLRIAGSLIVAVVLMSVLMLVLVWGTFVEAEYGTAVAQFALYDSRWFAFLLFLLAVNVACSLLVRFPWKPYHWPFLVAHVGILVLLFGCFLTWSGGEEAQITIPEGNASQNALKMNRQHFQLRSDSYAAPKNADAKEISTVSFQPGPFNWEDYVPENWFRRNDRSFRDTLWYAMKWGRRDQGSLPLEMPGVNIEVLDYFASSTTQPIPPLELSILWKKPLKTTNEMGNVKETPRNWETVKLDIQRREHYGSFENRGVRMQTDGGERINFYVCNSSAEVEAFRASAPDLSKAIGTWGQLVFHYAKKNYYVDVDQLIEKTSGGDRFPLGDSGFSLGNVQLQSRGPSIRCSVYAPNGEKEAIALFADLPDWNINAQGFGLFGTYWLDPKGPLKKDPGRTEIPVLDRMSMPRLDLLQGPNRSLYYRFWTGNVLASSGEVLFESGGSKPKFTVAQGTPDEAEIVVDRFIAHDLPGKRIISLPVGKERGAEQRAKLRVTVDGNEDVFWIRAAFPSVVPLPPESDQVRYVYGNGRTVRIVWNYDKIDLGFGVFLKKFEQRFEPGSKMPGQYSSLVDFVRLNASVKDGFTNSLADVTPLQENVLIRMNQPAVFQGSTLSKRYRIYQASFRGPYHPGSPSFQELYDGRIFPWESTPRESLYLSTLSVNDDPGRGWKYLGCFLVVFGIGWFLYRKND